MHCRSMLRCLDVLELCHSLKACDISSHRLQRTIHDHLDAAYEVYGRDYARPKAHFVLHLPEQLERHGCLLSTLVNERRHRVVKRYTRDRCGVQARWEVGALEEIVCFQAHECSASTFFSVGMIDEHPCGANAWRAMRDYFPDARRDQCTIARSLRTDWATLVTGDYIYFVGANGIQLATLEIVVRIGKDTAPQCVLATFIATSRTGEWCDWTADGSLLIVPAFDCMYAATCLANGGEVSAFIPYFMRNDL